MIYIRYVHIYMSMYLFQWKSHYTKRNHMCFNIYIWDSHPFVVQVGFEFIVCSRNVKRKPYSVCLVIVLLIINIIWYTVYSIYCDIIYETRRWIHAQEGMQRSHDAKPILIFNVTHINTNAGSSSWKSSNYHPLLIQSGIEFIAIYVDSSNGLPHWQS